MTEIRQLVSSSNPVLQYLITGDANPKFSFGVDSADNKLKLSSAGDITTNNILTVTTGSNIQLDTNIYIQDGSNSNPSITFTDDPDTGFYRVGANNLGIATGGTLRVDIGDTNTTVSNTLLVNDNFKIQDVADATKEIQFASNGTTSTKTTITAAQTVNRTITLPDATTTLVGTDVSQILTNKTISASSNTISDLALTDLDGTLTIAKGGTGSTTQTAAFDALAPTTTKGDIIVHNGTDNIRVAKGTDDLLLVADSNETSGVRWGVPVLPYTTVTATTSAATTSATYVQITTMTATPASGTYYVHFVSNYENSAGSATNTFGLHKAGTVVTYTEQIVGEGGVDTDSYRTSISIQDIVTVNGSEVVDIKYKTSTGTLTVYNRSMMFVRLA